MAKRNWTLQLESGRHVVELNHSAYSGKRRIWLDRQLVEESQKTVDLGSEHPFPLDDHTCTVVIRTNGLGFRYDLLLDGQPLEKRVPKRPAKPKPKPAAPKKVVVPSTPEHEFSVSDFLSQYALHLILTGVFAALGLFAMISGRGRAANDLFAVGVVALVGSLGPLVPLVLAALKTIDAVELDHQAIRWKDAAGDHSLTWQEVKEVYRVELVRNGFRTARLMLVPIAGDPVTFNRSLSHYELLAETAQSNHAAVWLSTRQAEVEQGGATFGPIVLRPDSIIVEGEVILWDALEQYALLRGYLCFVTPRHRGKGMKMVAVKDIPDYLLLMHLMEHYGKPATDSHQFAQTLSQ
jgi:hypothetical protein